MHNRITLILIVVATILLLDLPAGANTGTALMWLSAGHLLLGNLFIGIIEGKIANKYLHAKWGVFLKYLPLWMIAANYASVFIGVYYLAPLIEWLSPSVLGAHPVGNLPILIAAVFLFCFALSFLVEWLFLHTALWLKYRRDPENLLPLPTLSFHANLRAQIVSYAMILIPLYFVASNASLLTGIHRAKPADFAANPQAEVYFEGIDDKKMYVMRLDGSTPRLSGYSEKAFADKIMKYYNEIDSEILLNLYGYWNDDHRKTLDLRPIKQQTGSVFCEFWPDGGIEMKDFPQMKDFSLTMNMPYFAWYSRNATILPGDQVVYQVGDYIVLLDLRSRRLADLARGRNPIVFIPGMDKQPMPE